MAKSMERSSAIVPPTDSTLKALAPSVTLTRRRTMTNWPPKGVKPYYLDDSVCIVHGDCREILPFIEADVMLTDPPYGIQGGRGSGNRARGKGLYQADGWEDTPDYIRSVCVPVIESAVKRFSVVILTPGIPALRLYPPADDIGCFWTPAAVGHGSWGLTLFNPILFYGKDPRRGINPFPSGRQVTERPGIDGHPCPKPLQAWKWLLAKASVEASDVIIDPFMGSGTTLRVAKDLGHRAIGIDIEERYCEIAAKRMSQSVMALEV
jgi:hypothetical protein